MRRLSGADSFTIDVPGFAPVTYRRGDLVPERHVEHVPRGFKSLFRKVRTPAPPTPTSSIPAA